jgi:hypothetical protein
LEKNMNSTIRLLVCGLGVLLGLMCAAAPVMAVTSNLDKPPAAYRSDVSFTFKTHIGREGMVFVGAGGH